MADQTPPLPLPTSPSNQPPARVRSPRHQPLAKNEHQLRRRNHRHDDSPQRIPRLHAGLFQRTRHRIPARRRSRRPHSQAPSRRLGPRLRSHHRSLQPHHKMNLEFRLYNALAYLVTIVRQVRHDIANPDLTKYRQTDRISSTKRER